MDEKCSRVAVHLSGFQTRLIRLTQGVLRRVLAHPPGHSGSEGLEWCSEIGICMKFVTIMKPPRYLNAVEEKLQLLFSQCAVKEGCAIHVHVLCKQKQRKLSQLLQAGLTNW